jgi:hypothetical protein
MFDETLELGYRDTFFRENGDMHPVSYHVRFFGQT